MLTTNDGRGYYLVAADGGLFTFGDAQYMGGLGGQGLGTVGIVPLLVIQEARPLDLPKRHYHHRCLDDEAQGPVSANS